MNPLRLDEIVRFHIDAVGIGKRGVWHLFRHIMATLVLENGADIGFIQAMLGHAELSTTEIDTQVSIKALKAIHEATHPARLRQHGGNRDGVDQAADADTAAAHALLAAFGREGETEGLGRVQTLWSPNGASRER